MGMFDTFVINPPVECLECKSAISSVQSKAFGQSLERYQPGTLVNQSKLRYGIIEEEYLKKPFNTININKYLEQNNPLTALLAENGFYVENPGDEIFE